ncbi:MAG TPA: hypothetical protein VGU01_15460 [Sphingomicrobium sp.]|nr:hypothetical protein [Sphingomicrobium sp.]
MRVLLLLVAATCALTACKNNDMHDNTMNTEENLTAANIVSNDVTAIDAVTGDAANMAADVDMNYGNVDETGSAQPASEPGRAKTQPPKKPRAENLHASPEPTTTTATNEL